MDSAKVFIDTDNEITFILERILGSKQEKVCLVVPDRAAIFTSISGLKLIKRVVDKSNKLLVVVTLDENGATLARRAGLFVVSRIGEINDELWEKIRKLKFDLIKKDKKNVFYIPENEIKKLNTEADEKVESISLSEVLQKTFSEKAGDVVEHQANELQSNDEEKINSVPQIRIRIDDKDLMDKDTEVLENHQSDTTVHFSNSNLKNGSDDNSPKRQRKKSSGSAIKFYEGVDIVNQKKNFF